MLRVLQASRALAAAGVAAFHLSIGMGLERYGGVPAFGDITRHGFRGVDFFFVLSGFIILFAHAKDIGKPAAWTNYAHRRFTRVFPIYWLYSAGFIGLLFFGLGTDARNPESLGDWLTTWTLIRFTDGVPPLTVAWTLFHEVAFYALFSVLILSRRAGIIVLTTWALLCLALYDYPLPAERTAINVYTAAYNLLFLLGMGAYWLYRRGGSGFVEFGLGLVCIVFAALTMGLPHNLSPLVLAIGFALLVAGGTKMETCGYIKVPDFLNFIGNASYSIYLTHSSIQGLLLKVAMKSGLYSAIGPHGTYPVVLAGTIGLGCVVYVLVERPLIAYLQKRHKERRRRAEMAVIPAADAPRAS